MNNEESEKALTIFFLCLEQSLYTKTTAVLKTEEKKIKKLRDQTIQHSFTIEMLGALFRRVGSKNVTPWNTANFNGKLTQFLNHLKSFFENVLAEGKKSLVYKCNFNALRAKDKVAPLMPLCPKIQLAFTDAENHYCREQTNE